MKTITLTAPSHWASAIINGDYSGLDEEDVSALNSFLALQGVSFSDALTCEDAGFRWRHDASPAVGGADCQEYTFRA
ncbi:hypothetical protein [Nitratireductor soli]|uniref:hypothetical protein n=1 Tax=Nitratireductor soli TaxID=1670619 RepID=UPI00065E82AF|nr:hypothetical protein [Nitratireductor soli]